MGSGYFFVVCVAEDAEVCTGDLDGAVRRDVVRGGRVRRDDIRVDSWYGEAPQG
jgi:hypothetical protein